MDFIGDTDLRVIQQYLKRRDDRLTAVAGNSTPRKVPRKYHGAGAGEGGPRKASNGAEETEPPVGLEPTTARLRIESSTTELRWLVGVPWPGLEPGCLGAVPPEQRGCTC